jgi:hypothetical protein
MHFLEQRPDPRFDPNLQPPLELIPVELAESAPTEFLLGRARTLALDINNPKKRDVALVDTAEGYYATAYSSEGEIVGNIVIGAIRHPALRAEACARAARVTSSTSLMQAAYKQVNFSMPFETRALAYAAIGQNGDQRGFKKARTIVRNRQTLYSMWPSYNFPPHHQASLLYAIGDKGDDDSLREAEKIASQFHTRFRIQRAIMKAGEGDTAMLDTCLESRKIRVEDLPKITNDLLPVVIQYMICGQTYRGTEVFNAMTREESRSENRRLRNQLENAFGREPMPKILADEGYTGVDATVQTITEKSSKYFRDFAAAWAVSELVELAKNPEIISGIPKSIPRKHVNPGRRLKKLFRNYAG